jgi:hypothetical protein
VVDHPVKEALLSAHMSAMSNPKKTLIALAAASVFLASATGCSTGPAPAGTAITDEERASYEAARFGTAEAQSAANQELARLSATALQDPSAAEGVLDSLLRPNEWSALAKDKLCGYTATILRNADRDGTVVSAKVRAAADRVLDRC